MQVPANRLGYLSVGLSAYQLKVLKECITLVVFMLFACVSLGEIPQLKHFISFVLILAAVAVAYK